MYNNEGKDLNLKQWLFILLLFVAICIIMSFPSFNMSDNQYCKYNYIKKMNDCITPYYTQGVQR